jgi:rhamnogalacturonan endolyase
MSSRNNSRGGTPTITVNALGTGATSNINAPMAAVNGLTTTGIGTLMLSGTNSFAGLSVNGGTNTIAGNTTVSVIGGVNVHRSLEIAW